jgi:hypothetical protein
MPPPWKQPRSGPGTTPLTTGAGINAALWPPSPKGRLFDSNPQSPLKGLRMALAQMAVNYVLMDCGINSGNEFSPREEGLWAFSPMKLYRQLMIGYVDKPTTGINNLDMIQDPVEKFELLQDVANFAKLNKRGNCGERSAAAFCYLYDLNEPAVFPLCWCNLVASHANGSDIDHAFVVIGDVPPLGQQFVSDDPMRPGISGSINFGEDTVVCDPWRRHAHDRHEWVKYQEHTYARVNLRLDKRITVDKQIPRRRQH